MDVQLLPLLTAVGDYPTGDGGQSVGDARQDDGQQLEGLAAGRRLCTACKQEGGATTPFSCLSCARPLLGTPVAGTARPLTAAHTQQGTCPGGLKRKEPAHLKHATTQGLVLTVQERIDDHWQEKDIRVAGRCQQHAHHTQRQQPRVAHSTQQQLEHAMVCKVLTLAAVLALQLLGAGRGEAV